VSDPSDKNARERRADFSTSSGIPVARVYTAADRTSAADVRDLGMPGEYPFTRGIQPTMYRGRLWTMRQYSGFGTARQTNARFRYLLEQGQSGLSVAFDLPTQMGYDSYHPMAEGRSARSASRSPRSRTWTSCSRGSRSTRFPCR
jgi:methylmalonyl-CoA mutase N-terminal domain/subunit